MEDPIIKSEESPRPQVNLGVTLRERGRIEEAIDHFSKSLEFMPNNAEAQNNLGAAFDGLGRTREAIEHYSQAIQINPDYAEAQDNMGVVQARLGPMEKA
jgi:Flp pilus assembly protein TadD